MTGPQERIEQAERRLAKVTDLQEAIEGMQQELTAYREVLQRKLAVLERPPEPPRPPTPPPQRREPASPATRLSRSMPTIHGQPAKSGPTLSPPPAPAAAPARDNKVTPLPASARQDSKPVALPPAPVHEEDDAAFQDRRTSPRRKGNPVPILITNASASIDSYQGWVLDRSAGGLRILVDQATPVGTILAVRPAKSHGSFPWIQVRVRNCQPERSSWSLGVQFVHKPAWGELQAFG